MAVRSDSSSYSEQTLQVLLDLASSDQPAPGGGSVSAIAVGLAAALVEKTARLSPDWAEARGATAQAKRLRARSLPLAEEDAEVYGAVLEAMRGQEGDFALGQALSRAADVPLAIAEAALDVAELARSAADLGNQNLRGDAAAAASLAAGAAAATANLVEINLATTPEDERVLAARRIAESARAAAVAALTEVP